MTDMEVRTMQPGQAFSGPIYRAWDKLIAPSQVYAEVISYPRRYLHITEFPKGQFKGVLYNRDRQVLGKTSNLPIEQEGVFEVEADGTQIKSVTDVMAIGQDWDIYKLDYIDRVFLGEAQTILSYKDG